MVVITMAPGSCAMASPSHLKIYGYMHMQEGIRIQNYRKGGWQFLPDLQKSGYPCHNF